MYRIFKLNDLLKSLTWKYLRICMNLCEWINIETQCWTGVKHQHINVTNSINIIVFRIRFISILSLILDKISIDIASNQIDEEFFFFLRFSLQTIVRQKIQYWKPFVFFLLWWVCRLIEPTSQQIIMHPFPLKFQQNMKIRQNWACESRIEITRPTTTFVTESKKCWVLCMHGRPLILYQHPVIIELNKRQIIFLRKFHTIQMNSFEWPENKVMMAVTQRHNKSEWVQLNDANCICQKKKK